MKQFLFSVLTVFLFGFSNAQESNLAELVDGEKDIVVKILKKRMNGKYTVRINNDKDRNALEERYYLDNRLKLQKNRHIMYFDTKEDVNRFLSRNGYNLNTSKYAYWDHPSGEKNRDIYRNGTAKIGDISNEESKFSLAKDVYIFSNGGSYMDFPKVAKSSCTSSKKCSGNCSDKSKCIKSGKCKDVTACKSSTSCKTTGSALYSVYFDTDKSQIKISELARIAKALKADPKLKLRVEGNADIRGNQDYNDNLAQKRANRCKDILVKEYGISADRLNVQSNGEKKPLFQGFDKNRRVDFYRN